MLSAMLLFFATLIWGATTHNFRSLEASRIIGSFATSCGEAVPAIVVKDIFFLHERGWWMGVYMVFFQCLPSLFIVISGFVIEGLGWRWHFWVTLCSR
jgi:MFS family permease